MGNSRNSAFSLIFMQQNQGILCTFAITKEDGTIFFPKEGKLLIFCSDTGYLILCSIFLWNHPLIANTSRWGRLKCLHSKYKTVEIPAHNWPKADTWVFQSSQILLHLHTLFQMFFPTLSQNVSYWNMWGVHITSPGVYYCLAWDKSTFSTCHDFLKNLWKNKTENPS